MIRRRLHEFWTTPILIFLELKIKVGNKIRSMHYFAPDLLEFEAAGGKTHFGIIGEF